MTKISYNTLIRTAPGSRWTHLRAVNDADDAADPTIGTGIDLSSFKYVAVKCILGGTTPSYDLTPLYGDSITSVYGHGEKRTVASTGADIFVIDALYSTDFYIKCDGKSGTNPTISIYLMPLSIKEY